MEILGYIALLLVGLSLGLIGAGGGILIVPIMVFLFRFSQTVSVAYTMFILSASSSLGCILKYRQGEVRLKVAAIFGFVSTLSIFFVKLYLEPLIPATLFHIGSVPVTYEWFSMIIFALIMFTAAFSMLRSPAKPQPETLAVNSKTILNIVMCALGVGVLTALLGAGGGFLIIPCLMAFFGLEIKHAAGTSLAVIFMNGFFGSILDGRHLHFDWHFLLPVTAITAIGILLGVRLSRYFKSAQLKTGFAWFVILLAVVILFKEGQQFLKYLA